MVRGEIPELLEAYDHYEQSVDERGGPDAGLILHVCSPTADGICVIDVWESESAFKAWVARTPGQRVPKLYPVHGMRITDNRPTVRPAPTPPAPPPPRVGAASDPVACRPYVEEDQEAQGAHAAEQGEPRQEAELRPRLTCPTSILTLSPRAATPSTSFTATRSPIRTGGSRTRPPPRPSQWVDAQNERTRRVLEALPAAPTLHARFVELLAAPISTSCRVAGDRLFTLERSGGEAQFRLIVRSADDPARRGDDAGRPRGVARRRDRRTRLVLPVP